MAEIVPVRVVFCWAEASPYSVACWRALAARPGVDLHVVHPERLLDRPNPFGSATLLDGISNESFSASRRDLHRYLLGAVAGRRPDVVVLCGWIFWPYTRLVHAAPLQQARFILGMDSPWRGTVPQRLARLRLARFTGGLDLVVTAGERSHEYARRIGIPERNLRTGFYGFDYHQFAPAAESRPAAWPRRFIFAGRYAPEKDLATLVAAYARYRGQVDNPWTLTCCGTGPDSHLLRSPGITDAGFVAPERLPQQLSEHGAFVLSSRFEPWGLVIAEAAAAGLPIVCSSACGAALEVVRPYHNGIVFAPGDVEALTRALRWIHNHESRLREMGRRGQPLAAAFSAEAWAERWHNYMLETLETGADAQAR